MNIPLETFARVISKHVANKDTEKAITEMENNIENLDSVLSSMRDALSDMKSSHEIVTELADDLIEEMPLDDRLNFKRLAGIE